MATGCSCY